MANKYIWTKHAIQRLKERKIPRRLIDQALYHPDQTFHKMDHTIEQQKRIDGKTVAAIIKVNAKGEKVIISCWINPPFPGTRDHKLRQRYLAMQKAPFIKKLWLKLLNQLGL